MIWSRQYLLRATRSTHHSVFFRFSGPSKIFFAYLSLGYYDTMGPLKLAVQFQMTPTGSCYSFSKISSHFPPTGMSKKWSLVAMDFSVVAGAGLHLNCRMRRAVISFNSIIARFFPTHARDPFENGIMSSFMSFVILFASNHLSGSKASGSGNASGSRWVV